MRHRNPSWGAWRHRGRNASSTFAVARIPLKVVAAIVAVIIMVLALVAASPRSEAQGYPQVEKNPPLPQKCGLDIALVFDLSYSLSDQDIANSKKAGLAVVDGLSSTASKVGVYSFATHAPAAGNSNLGMTSLVGSREVENVKDAIKKLHSPDYDARHHPGQTNWDAGLRQLYGQKYNVVYFITDGIPNVHSPSGETDGTNGKYAIYEAMKRANELKKEGTRIVPLGVGAQLSEHSAVGNLKRISDDDSVLLVENYAKLVKTLEEEATKECRGEINITKKIVDEKGQPTGDSVKGWKFAVSNPTDGIYLDDRKEASTGDNGKVQFHYHPDSDDRTGSVKVTEIPTQDSVFQGVTCTDKEGRGVEVKREGNSFWVPASVRGKTDCEVSNSLSKLTVTKEVAGTDVGEKEFEIKAVCRRDEAETLNKTFKLAAGKSETVNVPAGSTCTVSENPDAHKVDQFDLKVSIDEATVQMLPGVERKVTVTNTYIPSTGSLTLTKQVEGYESPDKTYDITAKCTKDGVHSGEYKATLKSGESKTFDSIPVGSKCDISENEGPAKVPGYSLVVDIDKKDVEITQGQPQTVTVKNKYTPLKGALTVTNQVEGYRSGDKKYEITAKCTKDGITTAEHKATLQAGESKTFGDIPVDSKCVVSEDQNKAKVDGYSLEVSVDKNNVEITQGKAQTVTVKNKYTPLNGALTVVKKVEGDKPSGDRNYEITAKCTKPGTELVEHKATLQDGKSATFKDIPVGSKCTVSENEETAKVDGYSLEVSVDKNNVEITQGKAQTVTVKNKYTRLTSGLIVTKKVEGYESREKEYEITAKCTQNGAEDVVKKVNLKAGDSKKIDGIPVGSKCAISETPASAQVDGYFLTVSYAQPGLIEEGKIQQATVTNRYKSTASSIKVVKTIKGKEVPNEPGIEVEPGENLNIVYKVTNTGENPLTDVKVIDRVMSPKEQLIDGITCGKTVLFPGEFMMCQPNESILAPAGYGQKHHDVATVTANTLFNTTVQAENHAHAFTRKVGSLTVTKKVDGDKPFEKKEYDITATCFNPNVDAPNVIRTAKLKDGESTTFKDIPSGLICDVAEALDTAQVKGYSLEDSVDKNNVEIVPDTPQTVTITNKYTRLTGDLTVTKQVEGYKPSDDKEYEIIAKCFNPDVEGVEDKEYKAKVKAGQSTLVGKIPSGLVCNISEDLRTAEVDGYSLDVNVDKEYVTIDGDQPQMVTVTNKYTRLLGGLTVTKKVEGDVLSGDREYDITAKCTQDGADAVVKTVTLKANESKRIDGIPVGMKCEVSEDEAAAHIEDHTLKVSYEQPNGVIAKDVLSEAVVTNTYTPLDSSIKIVKTIGGQPAPEAPGIEVEPGADLKIVYEVTNTGKTRLTDVGVTDQVKLPVEQSITDITCEKTELVPGESTMCTPNKPVLAPAELGQRHHDVATVMAKTRFAKEVKDQSEAFAFTQTPGGFTLAKALTADVENVSAPWAEKEFTFDYTCQYGNDPAITGKLNLKPTNQKTVVETIGKLKVGTECTITEHDAKVENFDWKTEWDVKGVNEFMQDGNKVSFIIGSGEEGQNVAVGVKNTYTAKRGSFDIVKTLSGDAAATAASQKFNFDYSCTVGDQVVASGTKSVTGAGSVKVDNIPLVADCKVSEQPVTVKDTKVESTVTPKEFRLADTPEVKVTVDNKFDYVRGGLVISKFVTGNAVSYSPDQFTVNYRCVAPKQATNEVAALAQQENGNAVAEENKAPGVVEGAVTLAGGQSKVIENIIPGSTCEVWENAAPAKIRQGIFGSSTKPGADWAVKYTLDGKATEGPVQAKITANAATNVTVENQYNKERLNGLIILPIPLFFDRLVPKVPNGSLTPGHRPEPGKPSTPEGNPTPASKGDQPGTQGHAKKQAPAKDKQPKFGAQLALTGANVLWLSGIALMLMAFGALFIMRSRRYKK